MKTSRRDFLLAATATYFGAFFSNSRVAIAQFPKSQTDLPKEKPSAKTSSSNWSYSGCSLRNASEVTAALGTNGEFGKSTGIPQLDQGLNRELVFLKPYFDVNPGVLTNQVNNAAQFKSRRSMPQGKLPELHADFMSGWYTGIRAFQLPGQVNLAEISKEMFDIGDVDFKSPQHHGTPQERLSAYSAGADLSISSGAKTSFPVAFQQGGRLVGLW